MTDIRNLLSDIVSGDEESVRGSFDSVMATKVQDILDVRKISLTSDVFNSGEDE